MKRKRKNIKIMKMAMGLVLAFVMTILPINVCVGADKVTLCVYYEGNNIEAQNYSIWASTIKSYLSYDGSQTLMKVQAGHKIKGVWVEYYDLSYQKIQSLLVPQELPIFGGFYETDDNYYLVTGQNNPSESSEVECFRITQYDKKWNRISSVGLYDCNTTVPFDGGSLRMEDDGKYLLIRTSHKMYKGWDGQNHQANLTIQVDMDKMQITDSCTGILNMDYGYVSHSFNQFIRLENNHIIAADHGDAHPRALVLIKYPTNYTKGSFVPEFLNSCETVNMLAIPGMIGENWTCASMGGLEISDTSYLLAGNSVVQDENNLSRKTRNVFVSEYSKATGKVQINWITNFSEGDGTTSTPQFVKIAPNRYMLLWSRKVERVGEDIDEWDEIPDEWDVYYTQIDGEGKQVGEIKSFKGNLSDCVPIVVNNKLVWYVWNNEDIFFYRINLADMANDVSKVDSYHAWCETKVEPSCTECGYTLYTCVCGAIRKENFVDVIDHPYEGQGIEDGFVTLSCPICGYTITKGMPHNFLLLYNMDGGKRYTRINGTINFNVHDTIYYEAVEDYYYSDHDYDYIIEVMDPDIIELDTQNRIMTMKKGGRTTVRVTSKWNQNLSNEWTFVVGNAQRNEIRDFVSRLYTLVLDREADETGLESWTNALVSKKSSGVDVGYGFVFSEECKEKNLSNADFVEILYNTFMNRLSDEGGKTAWVSQIDAGVEREKVFEGFIYSAEFAEICSDYGINVGSIGDVGALINALSHYRNQNADITKFVARCYTEVMGREYEPEGLEAWCKVIIQKNNTPKQVAQNFIFSAEFVQKDLSDEEYVKVLYRIFMGREADEGGLAAWGEVLKSGREDRAKVLEGFSDSVEFDGILRSFGLN